MPSAARATPPRSRRPARAIGFGFVPGESQHHFLVTLGKGAGDVRVSEHHTWEPDETAPTLLEVSRRDASLRVVLDRDRWDRIAGEIRRVFNLQLKQDGLPAGRLAGERVPLSRALGKELVLLAWAIEDADPGLIPTAMANWAGLRPEERWWLYTMTRAATGHAVDGRNRGWRKAVRYALTENPVVGRDTMTTEVEQ